MEKDLMDLLPWRSWSSQLRVSPKKCVCVECTWCPWFSAEILKPWGKGAVSSCFYPGAEPAPPLYTQHYTCLHPIVLSKS